MNSEVRPARAGRATFRRVTLAAIAVISLALVIISNFYVLPLMKSERLWRIAELRRGVAERPPERSADLLRADSSFSSATVGFRSG